MVVDYDITPSRFPSNAVFIRIKFMGKYYAAHGYVNRLADFDTFRIKTVENTAFTDKYMLSVYNFYPPIFVRSALVELPIGTCVTARKQSMRSSRFKLYFFIS